MGFGKGLVVMCGGEGYPFSEGPLASFVSDGMSVIFWGVVLNMCGMNII